MKPKTNIEFPEYLNSDFFTKCLLTGLNRTDIQVRDFEMEMGTNPGENYTSFMYRVYVSYTDDDDNNLKKLQLIVKSMPTDNDRKILEDINLHGKETDIYFELLPQVHEILVDSRVAPMCYYSVRKPVQTIAFDDLKPQGYTLADRVEGLDKDHCILVLDKLAKLHAAGMHVLEQKPNLRETFKQGFFCRDSVDRKEFQIYFRQNLKKGAEMALDMPGYEHFAPKLMALYDNFPVVALRCTSWDLEDIATINHGDVWVNNIMFRHNENCQPDDALFVDFQASFINSSAFDLNYFFVTSATLPIMMKKRELIATYYYPAFEKTLKKIGAKNVPSLERILHEVDKHELFSVFNFFGAFPLISLDWEEAKTDIHEQFTNEVIASRKRNVGMSSERFVNTFKYVLKYYDELSVFERAMDGITQ